MSGGYLNEVLGVVEIITTRITAGAFLSCGNKVLLMKRGLHKELGPGLWAGVGGHLDMCDITNPRALDLAETCYREVQEETGIDKSQIRNMKLRYIAVRKDGADIRLHHYYFGELEKEIPLPECSEGEFHWKDKNEILALPMTTSGKEAVRHWINNPDIEGVYFIAVNPAGESAVISEV